MAKMHDVDNDWLNHKIDVLRRLKRMETVLNEVQKKLSKLCTTVTVIAIIVSVAAGGSAVVSGAAGKLILLIFG